MTTNEAIQEISGLVALSDQKVVTAWDHLLREFDELREKVERLKRHLNDHIELDQR